MIEQLTEPASIVVLSWIGYEIRRLHKFVEEAVRNWKQHESR